MSCPNCGHSIYPAKNSYACNNPLGPCIFTNEEFKLIGSGENTGTPRVDYVTEAVASE